ncbi:MAG: hypothetical protein ABJF23_10265 [Bryobacteraceae bacterium]
MWQHLKTEWEYASIELTGNTVTGVSYDAQTAEGMRGETMEELSGHLENSEPDLLAILNTLGEEGWEIAEKLERGGGVVHLLLKRPGSRRAQKDAETRALMKKALDDMDL